MCRARSKPYFLISCLLDNVRIGVSPSAKASYVIQAGLSKLRCKSICAYSVYSVQKSGKASVVALSALVNRAKDLDMHKVLYEQHVEEN